MEKIIKEYEINWMWLILIGIIIFLCTIPYIIEKTNCSGVDSVGEGGLFILAIIGLIFCILGFILPVVCFTEYKINGKIYKGSIKETKENEMHWVELKE